MAAEEQVPQHNIIIEVDGLAHADASVPVESRRLADVRGRPGLTSEEVATLLGKIELPDAQQLQHWARTESITGGDLEQLRDIEPAEADTILSGAGIPTVMHRRRLLQQIKDWSEFGVRASLLVTSAHAQPEASKASAAETGLQAETEARKAAEAQAEAEAEARAEAEAEVERLKQELAAARAAPEPPRPPVSLQPPAYAGLWFGHVLSGPGASSAELKDQVSECSRAVKTLAKTARPSE